MYQNGVGLTFYVDGVVEPNIGEEDPSGTLNWIPDEDVRVAIGDEVGEIVDYPRTFHGTYHRLLLFTRALDPAEVAEFAATPY